MSIDPLWLAEARRYLGVREIPGVNHHPLILAMWKAIKRGGIRDDETPWCAAFVGFCLENVGIVSSRFESARSYLEWGRPLDKPVPGCITVLGRTGGGHVAFGAGVDRHGDLLLLGGNQGNSVSIAAFPRSRVLGYRWPLAVPLPDHDLVMGEAPATVGEA
ncbi:TIGR02594 family protein [Hydrogenophaga sp. SNF1]|uniref:TIGR02594 family protein n=1 Tax=Hydrogenophaga sp. SNF1 TaxID=3098762 RepID=UPI002ACBFE51|nr:TIGR02594 family protein [Hydrogenophaga sp. SNF1]WQB84915.1 TIGR02594 family protein [Hydrogenophaga sp. SNF1]